MGDYILTNRKTGEHQIVSQNTPFAAGDIGVPAGLYDVRKMSRPAELIVRGNNTIADVAAIMPASFRFWVAGHGDFQDSGGTTPAGVNDPVGYFTDHSGAGIPAIRNGSDASRPVLRQTGNAFYWEFDATDDRMNLTTTFTGSSLTMGMSYKHEGRNVIPFIYVSSGTKWVFATTAGSTNTSLTSGTGGPLNDLYIDNALTDVATRGEAAAALTSGTSFLMNIGDSRDTFENPYFGGPFSNFTMPERVHALFLCAEELSPLQREIWHDFAIAAATTGVSAS